MTTRKIVFSNLGGENSQFRLYTMADAKHLLYNLGRDAVERRRSDEAATFLQDWAMKRWNLLSSPHVHDELTIRIPARRQTEVDGMPGTQSLYSK